MNKGKLLIIGASAYQHYIYKVAKENNIWIGSVDGDAKAPMFSKADKYWNIDFSDTEAVIDVAKSEGFDAVATINIDQGMQHVEKIKKGLGLPHTDHETIVSATRKDLMRKVWSENGINQPEYFVFEEQNKEEINSLVDSSKKFIIKPVDNAAKRGISLLDGTTKDLKSKIDLAFKYSKIKKVIVEEFIEGNLIFAATYIKKNKSVITLMHQKINDSLVQLQFDAPIIFDEEVENKIKDEANNAAKCFGKGPFHTEIIIDKNGIPFLVETSPRISYATVSLSRLTAGFDPVTQLLTDSCPFPIDKVQYNDDYHATLKHITPPVGSVFNKTKINAITNANLYEIIPVVKDQHIVKKLKTNEQRVLYFTTFGEDKGIVKTNSEIIASQLLKCFE